MLPEPPRRLEQTTECDGAALNLAQADRAVRTAREQAPEQLAPALLELARLLARAGRYREARQTADEAYQLQDCGALAAEALITSSYCALQTDNLDEAEDSLYRAADLCRKSGDQAGLATVTHNLAAGIYLTRGKFELAMAAMEEAGALRVELGQTDWDWLWLRAYIYLLKGNRRLAHEALDELVREIEPATRSAGSYYFLWSRLAIAEGEFEKAREYLRLGLRIATRLGTPDLSLWMRIEQSHFYRKTQRLAEAREWSEDAIQMARRGGLRYFEGLALYELALVEWDAAQPDTAAEYLNGAEEIFQAFKAAYDLAALFFTRALWSHQANLSCAAQDWVRAAHAIENGGYAFLLETQQESAFPLIAAHLRGAEPAAQAASERLFDQLSRVSPPPLRIATLGQFSVWKGRALIPERSWQKRKAGELFRFLLIQPNRSAAKEAILEAIWPERGLDTGTGLLHQSTSALRRILEPDLPEKFPSRYLFYEGEQITLALPPGSTVDFEFFRRDLHSALQARDAELVQDALLLYGGELFPADRYSLWSGELRESIADLYYNGMLELAGLYFKQMQYADALDCCRGLLRRDPLHEEACMLAMRSYHELGSVTSALRIYQTLKKELQAELGVEPGPNLQKLARHLEKRSSEL